MSWNSDDEAAEFNGGRFYAFDWLRFYSINNRNINQAEGYDQGRLMCLHRCWHDVHQLKLKMEDGRWIGCPFDSGRWDVNCYLTKKKITNAMAEGFASINGGLEITKRCSMVNNSSAGRFEAPLNENGLTGPFESGRFDRYFTNERLHELWRPLKA